MSNTQGQVLSMGSLRGTKREYETVTILRPASNKTDILDLVGKVQGIFKDFDATLVQIENWGSRTLAYPIKRSNTGIYLYWRYLGGSDVVREVERNLEIIDMVLRYTTVKVDEDVDPNARPSEVTLRPTGSRKPTTLKPPATTTRWTASGETGLAVVGASVPGYGNAAWAVCFV